MPALDQSIGTTLILFALIFGVIDILVFAQSVRHTHGLRRVLAGLILFMSTYAVVVYSLSVAGLLPDGAQLLSFLLRPVVVGLLGFLAAYGILDRRH